MLVIACPHRFAQSEPHKTCRNDLWNTLESLHKGYEIKCPDPRCSHECNARWSWRHWTCVHKLLYDHIDDNLVIHRGHLKMPPNANPDKHKTSKKEFLRILERWRAQHGYTLEIHAVLHIDDWLNAHWDTIAYSDAPIKPLKTAVSDAWARAGGLRQSLVRVEEDELIASLKYQVKDTTRPERAKRFLPASRKDMGMNHHWSTRARKDAKGFWNGTSEKAMWEEWKRETFANGDGQEQCPILSMKSRTKFRDNMVSKLKRLTPDYESYLGQFDWHVPEVIGGSDSDVEALLESLASMSDIEPS